MNTPIEKGDSEESGRGSQQPLPAESCTWKLRLYIAGQTPKSLAAFANLKRICDRYLPQRHEIELIDLLAKPRLAKEDGIIAVPTLVRKEPAPVLKIIGDLSDKERVVARLDFPSEPSAP